jgi:hypothetical protein
MRERKWLGLAVIVVTAAALVAGACGGSNPAAPTGTKRIVLKGTVLGTPGASGQSAQVAALAANGEKIKVTVQQNTSITTTVSSNGTFELEGVPEGNFTLVFSTSTTVIGTVTVPGGADQEIHIVVNVTVTVVVIVKIEIDGHDVPPPGPHDGDDDD